jgi:predicted NAD/FAD-binding protein
MTTHVPTIGIIGAGPAGLSLARLLTERGLADVTVLERDTRVGGKSLTVQHQGIGHEMGTCYVALGYTRVRSWMQEAGIRLVRLLRSEIVDLEGKRLSFSGFVAGPNRLVSAIQFVRYYAAWLRFRVWELAGAKDDAYAVQLAQPFGEWLAQRGLDAVRRFALRSMTVMGYGRLDTVPALYGLRWSTPSLAFSGMTGFIMEPAPGWQALWEWIAARHDVRLAERVSEVKRFGDGFEVRTDRGFHRFDHLVLTTPLDEARGFFPFDPEEEAAFAGIRWGRFHSTLVQVRGWFRDRDTRVWQRSTIPEAGESRHRMVGARRTTDKSEVARIRAAGRDDVYVCYQYAEDGVTSEQLLEILQQDIASEGGEIVQVLQQRTWKYPPQLSPDAIRGGGVRASMIIQGRNNTWFSGASLCHEAVDNIVDFNEELADEMAVRILGQSEFGRVRRRISRALFPLCFWRH